MKISGLKVNGITNPVGFSFDRVLCSWKVTETDAKWQENVCIEVSLTPDFAELLCKKEGETLTSDETELAIALLPRSTYFWRVAVTGDNGECACSDTAFFETGKMEEPWEAKWIGPAEEDKFHPVLRREFAAEKKVARARLYICGLGLYEAYINGKKVGNEYLAPYLNDYVECLQYQTYDVTELLAAPGDAAGQNEIEIMLGKGWYMGVFGLQNQPNLFGSRMAAIAELHIEYGDGSSQMVATDERWRYRGSDIEESGIYFGETLNRLLWQGKENPWKTAEVLAAPGRLTERYSLPVVEKETLHPVEILHTPAGETVVDMGQNHAGFMEFTANFPTGTKIVIECGEVLQNGNFYHDNYRDAESAFTYISDGRRETVRPHFTYFGYRYLRVTGWPGEPKETDITAKVIYSDLERTGYIRTANEKINRLYENCLWSQKSNFIDVPTDCPQRSERLGWTGDAQVFAATASLNMDTRAFYRKFLRDLRGEQKRADGAIPNYFPSLGELGGAASVWGDVGTFVPDVLYRTYGSTAEMEAYYPMMRDWVEYMHRIDAEKGNRRLFLNGFQFGDWLALDGVTEQSFKGSTDDDYIGTVYYYKSAILTAEMAERLGYGEDAAKYRQLAKEICDAVLREYFTPAGRLACDTQAAYLIALRFRLYVDWEMLISQLKNRLKKDCYQIKCGFVGAPLLCTTLCEIGMAELAYRFLFQEEFPSWLYCVNLGATTIWERWNSLLPDGTISGTGMNSLNHYSYGSVVEFLYTYAGGLRAGEPGWRSAVIAPVPDMRFGRFFCSYDSVCGKYVSDWEIKEDGVFVLRVEIPFGCTAKVILPRCDGSNVAVCERSRAGGETEETAAWKRVEYRIGADGGVTLAAGAYEFSYLPLRDFRRIYDETTRLLELAGDREAMEILREELPAAYGMVTGGDKENGNLALGELGGMFFLGFTPEAVARATERICALTRW